MRQPTDTASNDTSRKLKYYYYLRPRQIDFMILGSGGSKFGHFGGGGGGVMCVVMNFSRTSRMYPKGRLAGQTFARKMGRSGEI